MNVDIRRYQMSMAADKEICKASHCTVPIKCLNKRRMLNRYHEEGEFVEKMKEEEEKDDGSKKINVILLATITSLCVLIFIGMIFTFIRCALQQDVDDRSERVVQVQHANRPPQLPHPTPEAN